MTDQDERARAAPDDPQPSALRTVLTVHGSWWCRSVRACQKRKTALLATMQAALDAVWASLEADGWTWPV